jgi:hypothetical protein
MRLSTRITKQSSITDIEQAKGSKADYDARLRQVDPRTIQYVIVGGTKYTLKK